MKREDRLANLKEDFERLLQQAEPNILPLFFTWIDLRISSMRFESAENMSTTPVTTHLPEVPHTPMVITPHASDASDRYDKLVAKEIHPIHKFERYDDPHTSYDGNHIGSFSEESYENPINLSINRNSVSPAETSSGIIADSTNQDLEDTQKEGATSRINECNICHKQFQYRSSYRRHMKIHQGIFSHLCDVCNRKFTRKEHFLRHKCNRRPNKPNRAGNDTSCQTSVSESPIPQAELPVLSQAGPFNQEIIKDEDSPKSIKCESRRKSNKPRKIVSVGINSFSGDLTDSASDEEILDEVSHGLAAKKKYAPFSNADWATNQEPDSKDVSETEEKSASPKELGESVLTLDSGSYKVQAVSSSPGPQKDQDHDDSNSFIKVVKQGNYLKLKSQMQIVSGKLCFVCPNCNKIFHRSSNFSRHMRIHRGIYSYVCPNCHRGFFRKEHYQKHKCHRKSMSHIWNRKTKLDMDMFGSSDNLSSNNDSEPGLDVDLLNESGDSQIENDSSSVLSCDSKDIM